MNPRRDKETNPTPAETVIGWLLVFLSFLVMSIGFTNGEINTIFWLGVAQIIVGIIFVIIGKRKQKISQAYTVSK